MQATGEHFQGTVSRTTDALDRSTRTMQAEIDVPNKGHKLAPGMYANVVLQVQQHENALTVPIEAVAKSGDKASVLVVDADGHVQLRPIKTGMESPNRVEVVSGLREGDQVIVGNLNSYQPGELVHAKQTAMASYDAKQGAE